MLLFLNSLYIYPSFLCTHSFCSVPFPCFSVPFLFVCHHFLVSLYLLILYFFFVSVYQFLVSISVPFPCLCVHFPCSCLFTLCMAVGEELHTVSTSTFHILDPFSITIFALCMMKVKIPTNWRLLISP